MVNMKRFLCLSLCLALCLVCVTGLRCIQDEGCTEAAIAGLDCEYGHLPGICNRCECAKGPGEVCGGPWGSSGFCAEGLVCDKDPEDFNAEGECRPGKSGDKGPKRG
ncbi:crustacean hematopoietic factor-like protein [Penaeus vannamei]|uniref:Crustacean hematopoietic factor-like protein n=1 Tax=Penaeus vannamei TaxID=6689 RepID=A0A3R7M6D0_PENVA|nr:single insulin-like growth factor-binding domain protein-2 [Penaeus vannamei]ROT74193.1 crustacean hematopoietic factor-like protein [Penaeus vannamei]